MSASAPRTSFSHLGLVWPVRAALILAVAVAFGARVDGARADGAKGERRNAIVRAVEGARSAVVSIHTTHLIRQQIYEFELPPVEGKGIGSGVIFHPEGYVITNAHVIARASRVLVDVTQPDGSSATHEGRIVAVDLPHDLGILRLLPPDGRNGPPGPYPYLPLGRSDDLMVGETVIALGNPFAIGLTATRGIIGGLHRKLRAEPEEDVESTGETESGGRLLWNDPEKALDDFIQTDAAINPGNSGGPLLDVTGRWIGVSTAIWNRLQTAAEGIGFAVPVNQVRSLVARAFKRRLIQGDWLGLEMEAGENGEALVRYVYPKGPAHALSLQPGDRVVSIDGVPTPTLFDMHWRMAFPAVGAALEIGVERDGEPVAKAVRIHLLPVATSQLSDRHLGLAATDFTDSEGQSQVLPVDAGVLVVRVREGGPADETGLRPGDLIIRLGTYRIRHTDDLLLFLQYVQPGNLVEVQIVRNIGAGTGRRVLREKLGRMVAE